MVPSKVGKTIINGQFSILNSQFSRGNYLENYRLNLIFPSFLVLALAPKNPQFTILNIQGERGSEIVDLP